MQCEPMTSWDQQGSSLSSGPTFPSLNPHYNPTFGSFDLVEGRDQYTIQDLANLQPAEMRIFNTVIENCHYTIYEIANVTDLSVIVSREKWNLFLHHLYLICSHWPDCRASNTLMASFIEGVRIHSPQKGTGRCPHGVMVKVMDCGIVVR